MIEVKRKQGESFDGLFRRFKRRISQSGVDLEVRKRKVREPVPNRNAKRKTKVRGIRVASKIEWMIKSGKATEEDFRQRRKRRR
ncbi:hypothetical protein A3C17_03075 [Candidatus Uhrbacteria bacterium RIFCSPHIGHO2_02_FULL_53_13]|uniref:30S ribosomal protein S21 n=1 Tax=Candidatus Uhrbacteria bacterium RIFCSPHIGHO2_02_FULL_53_13 TaxID=1802389 RepID=A0A1F7U0G4_9BACT|nr:MAG: hypothetical protein A3C17_03075 [Candidatus Uhrbacteria bacterium RIFCSPHIGHO2_02_FULL_53_13]